MFGSAVALALALHVAWWWSAVPRRIALPQRRVVQAPAFSVALRAPGFAEKPLAAGAREALSPTLFSVPATAGFSRDVLLRPMMAAPVIKPFEDTALPLLSSNEISDADYAAVEWPQNPRLTEVRPVPIATFAPAAPATNLQVQLLWSDGLAGLAPSAVAIPAGSVWDDDKPWEATVFVEADAQGVIRHALLEKPSGSKVRNQEISRMVRAMRVATSDEVRSGRLTMRFAGHPASAPANGEAGRAP